MSDQQIKTQKRVKLTGKDNYNIQSISTKIALLQLEAWKVIEGERPKISELFQNIKLLDEAYKEQLLETLEDNEITTQKIVANRKKFKKYLITENK